MIGNQNRCIIGFYIHNLEGQFQSHGVLLKMKRILFWVTSGSEERWGVRNERLPSICLCLRLIREGWILPDNNNTCPSFSPSIVSPGWGGSELSRRRDGVISPENHSDPWRFRVPGLHHSVRRHRHTGPIHLTRGITNIHTHFFVPLCFLLPFFFWPWHFSCTSFFIMSQFFVFSSRTTTSSSI